LQLNSANGTINWSDSRPKDLWPTLLGKSGIKTLAKMMTLGQIAMAEELARDWKPNSTPPAKASNRRQLLDKSTVASLEECLTAIEADARAMMAQLATRHPRGVLNLLQARIRSLFQEMARQSRIRRPPSDQMAIKSRLYGFLRNNDPVVI
jgi:hypothetical protein